MIGSLRRLLLVSIALIVLLVTGCQSETVPSGQAQALPSPTAPGESALSPVLTRTGDDPVTLAPIVLTPGSCHEIDGKADRRCTPGAVNPLVIQDAATHYSHTICAPPPPPGQQSWIARQRPATSYTNALKAIQMPEYGLSMGKPTAAQMKSTEEDHFYPLEAGGAPQDPNNLWPQPWAGLHGARKKDTEEGEVHRHICSDPNFTVEDGLAQIRADWSHD